MVGVSCLVADAIIQNITWIDKSDLREWNAIDANDIFLSKMNSNIRMTSQWTLKLWDMVKFLPLLLSKNNYNI